MNLTTQLSTAPLRSLYETDASARAIFNWLAGRRKGAKETAVRVAAERAKLSYAEVVRVFREFDRLGVGAFIAGRKGWETRIAWSYDVVSIGRVAIGETDQAELVSDDDPATEDDATGLESHDFRLRPDLIITILLPSDFSLSEAKRLGTWLSALPMQTID